MTQLIDLMPDSCRRKLGQRKEIRRWIGAYAVLIGTLTTLTTLLTVMERTRLSEVRSLRSQVDLDAGQQKIATELESQIESLEMRIHRHDILAWPVRMSDLVAALGQATPESVTLTSFNVTPRQDRGPVRGRGGQSDERPEAGRRLVIEMKGLAPDDVHIASFVAGLETHPLFRRIAVDYTRRTDLRGREAREFGLSFEVDASKRYAFADADASIEVMADAEEGDGL